ncbi:VOC family protein [Halococcoides cellulosivorans]|uniref:VOC domain-containing protein n=1 Tax=Halococcoides cellulosivorans TaxID=1679096 RepID=A0A2R4X1G3_9EURY|nr:VOC family protein [Halococcoides cellulosivorans]AWB27638.1 hypothetical protein HARCEL1_07910 [Halococcoides cellulosivorans]
MATLDAHHVGITVEDLDRCVDFYRETFEFEVLDRFEVAGEAFERVTDTEAAADFVHLDAGGVRLELVRYDPPGAAPASDDLQDAGTTHLAVAVDDAGAFVADLPPEVETVSDPQTTASGTTVCFLRDPEGNLVELIET